ITRADIVVELTLSDRALLGQWLVAREVPFGFRQLRLAFSEPRPRLVERGCERTLIDLEEHVVFMDECAFVIRASHQIAGHLRPDLSVDGAIECGDPLAGDRDGLRNDRHEGGTRGRGRRRRIFTAATGDTAERSDGENEDQDVRFHDELTAWRDHQRWRLTKRAG